MYTPVGLYDYDNDVFNFDEDLEEEMAAKLFGSDQSLVTAFEKPKKKRIRMPVKIPRVCKNDIRRHYGTILARCLNGLDENFAFNFVNTFMGPSTMVQVHGLPHSALEGMPTEGITPIVQAMWTGGDVSVADWIRQHLFVCQRVFSDAVYRIRSQRVISKLRTRCSTVIIELEAIATQYLDLDLVYLLETMFNKLLYTALNPHLKLPPVYSLTTPVELVDNRMFFDGVLGYQPAPLAQPVEMRHLSRLTLHLDDNKYIQSIEWADLTVPPSLQPALDRAKEMGRRNHVVDATYM